jgi:hypothetical protein
MADGWLDRTDADAIRALIEAGTRPGARLNNMLSTPPHAVVSRPYPSPASAPI